MKPRNVIIMGAGGRDFHNFIVYFKDNPAYRVVAFTATQIPGIEKRAFPQELAGRLYKKDIPIFPEAQLSGLIKKYKVNDVVLAYSDLSHEEVMHKASTALAAGANFTLLGPQDTQLRSRKLVIAVCAVRTGAGKSPTTRRVVEIIKEAGLRPVVVRHSMPYGDLRKQAVQRFGTVEDLKKHQCTIEESEEYMPHIEEGTIVYAGVDYTKILKEAEKEADVILFDGGNNDFSFFRPDLLMVLADARRPGHEVSYYPGEAVARMADAVIINKVKSGKDADVRRIEENIRCINPQATILKADMPLAVDRPELITGKRILAIDDGPTLTHGGLPYGAAYLVAKKYGARSIVDPRPFAVGSNRKAFRTFRHLGPVLPALGYGQKQLQELEQTINRTPCDTVIIGTPVDLRRFIAIRKPAVRVTYTIRETGKPRLREIVERALKGGDLI